MKKLLFLPIVALLLLSGSRHASAQTTSVFFYFAGDSSWIFNCNVPDTLSFMIYGHASGYPPGDSVLIGVHFGDGTSTSFYSPILQNYYFSEWNIQHVYVQPGNYSVMFTATGSDGVSDTIFDNTVLVAASCGNVSGKVYVDSNSNCTYNTGEAVLPFQSVTASLNGNQIAWTYTDSLGDYYFQLPSGFTYTIELPSPIATINCPAAGTYTVGTMPATGLDFGYGCVTGFDYTGAISTWGFRANNTSITWINASNLLLSCSSPPSTVTVTLDPLLSYMSSTITPTAINGQQLTFSGPALIAGLQNMNFSISTMTLPGAVIGDTLCIVLTVDPVAGDQDSTNNLVIGCSPVRNSCDPNEKQEAEAGVGSATILPGEVLEYTIHFQNVGNDDAYDVYIVDTLDANLDPLTFTFLNSSHLPKIRFMDGDVLKFEFKNINLPAASVNEPLSHGYVKYRIQSLPGLIQGDEIHNTAHIFFDYNPAIITNTVEHVIDLSSGIQNASSQTELMVYPNPATDYFNIITKPGEPYDVTIADVSGRVILHETIQDEAAFSTKSFSKGIYTITIENGVLRTVRKLVIR